MKLKQGVDFVKFLHCVQACRGDVLLVNASGDRLDLKSTLCEYIFVAAASSPEMTADGEIHCKNDADYALLSEFLED